MSDDPARRAVQVSLCLVDPDRRLEPGFRQRPLAIAGSPRRPVYLLARRPVVLTSGGWPINMGIGFLSGLTGGFAAFPSGPIAIWCSMKGWDKGRQRGEYQPFIFVMQFLGLATIALMQGNSGRAISDMSVVARDALVFVPGTLFGSWFGLQVFHGLSDRGFGRCFAVLLAASGVLMLAQSA